MLELSNFSLSYSIITLISAAFWDYLVGDPNFLIHPVQIMGWFINLGTKIVLNSYQHKWQRRIGGLIISLILILGSGLVGWLLIKMAYGINTLLGIGAETILISSCFAGKSLRQAAENVLKPLLENDIAIARSNLSMYVGRDTTQLSAADILRAILETVGENSVDGVTAPLFYAIVGIGIGIGAAPLVLAYKASSTLDSMIGYRREPYQDLGWFPAQLEDRLTWIPCRLTVVTLAIFSGNPQKVFAICSRDAIKDPSPNSGWSECVYAATLGVQLGGSNTYRGVTIQKPILGNSDREITPQTITTAMNLTRYCFLSWLGIFVLSSSLF